MTLLIKDAVAVRKLTEREKQTIALVCEGVPHKEMASKLGISIKTVHWYVGRTYRKLGLPSSIALLVKFAIRNGLTTL